MLEHDLHMLRERLPTLLVALREVVSNVGNISLLIKQLEHWLTHPEGSRLIEQDAFRLNLLLRQLLQELSSVNTLTVLAGSCVGLNLTQGSSELPLPSTQEQKALRLLQ